MFNFLVASAAILLLAFVDIPPSFNPSTYLQRRAPDSSSLVIQQTAKNSIAFTITTETWNSNVRFDNFNNVDNYSSNSLANRFPPTTTTVYLGRTILDCGDIVLYGYEQFDPPNPEYRAFFPFVIVLDGSNGHTKGLHRTEMPTEFQSMTIKTKNCGPQITFTVCSKSTNTQTNCKDFSFDVSFLYSSGEATLYKLTSADKTINGISTIQTIEIETTNAVNPIMLTAYNGDSKLFQSVVNINMRKQNSFVKFQSASRMCSKIILQGIGLRIEKGIVQSDTNTYLFLIGFDDNDGKLKFSVTKTLDGLTSSFKLSDDCKTYEVCYYKGFKHCGIYSCLDQSLDSMDLICEVLEMKNEENKEIWVGERLDFVKEIATQRNSGERNSFWPTLVLAFLFLNIK